MLPSASLSSLPDIGSGNKPTASLYEPIHGSAPDIAGQEIANPIAMILSAAMMLRYSLNLHDEASAVEGAITKVLNEGYRTEDISKDGGQVVPTSRMGDIIASLI